MSHFGMWERKLFSDRHLKLSKEIKKNRKKKAYMDVREKSNKSKIARSLTIGTCTLYH